MSGIGSRVLRWVLAGSALTAPCATPARAGDPPPPPPAGAPPAPAPAARPPAPEPHDAGGVSQSLAAAIDKALERGVKWLAARQDREGSWGDLAEAGATNYNGGTDVYEVPAGPTALAVYTLLKCGVPDTDPVIRKGFAFLRRKHKRDGNAYEVGAILLAITATADPFKQTKDSRAAGEQVRLTGDMRRWAQTLTDVLVSMRAPNGWRYWGKSDGNWGGPQDVSSTQFAALALFSAGRCGISVDPAVWSGVLTFVRAQQEASGPPHERAVAPLAPEGAAASGPTTGGAAGAPPAKAAQDSARGFAYILGRAKDDADRVPSGGMTACGIGSLMMSRFVLSTRWPKAWATLDAQAVQTSVYDGLAWLDLHWNPEENPPDGESHWHVYYMYCVERAMDLVGAHRLGKHFWYAEMAGKLVPKQAEKGFWDSDSAGANGAVLDTCFALLFLHRATRGGIPFPSVTGGSEDPPVDNR